MASPHPQAPARPTARPHPNLPAALAIGSAALAFAGVYATWLTVTVAGFSGPGTTQSGWDGRDGWTVAVTAAVSAVLGVLLLLGRRDAWLPNLLVLAGVITIVIAVVNVAGAGSKADDIHLRFDIAASEVTAHSGVGLWMVGLAGVGLLAGALLAHQVRQTLHRGPEI